MGADGRFGRGVWRAGPGGEVSKALWSTPGHEARWHLAQAYGVPPQLSKDVTALCWHLPTLSTSRFCLLLSLTPAAPSEVHLPDIMGTGVDEASKSCTLFGVLGPC